MQTSYSERDKLSQSSNITQLLFICTKNKKQQTNLEITNFNTKVIQTKTRTSQDSHETCFKWANFTFCSQV